MSLTSAQLITVTTAIHDLADAATNIEFTFPTGTTFKDKADYWAFVNTANDTAYEIDTDLIKACWLNYLRFEDVGGAPDAPTKEITWQLTVFHETAFDRQDEADAPDAFQTKMQLTDHEHDTAVFSLQIQFQGSTSLGLSTAIFSVGEVVSIEQPDNTERDAALPYVPGAIGSLTQMELKANLQLVAC